MTWLLALAVVIGFPLVLRPLYIEYGVTRLEQTAIWPGDETVPGASPSGTRGVTIEAPAEAVWPWIAQIGQDRAGFYSYRWLENLFGAEMPDVKQIVPEWSTRKPGQDLLMTPPSKYGGKAKMELVSVQPSRHLVYKNQEGTWAFVLVPLGPGRCRFIARGTSVPPKNPLALLFRWIVFDPIHFVMELKMMRSIKRLAESAVVAGALAPRGLQPEPLD